MNKQTDLEKLRQSLISFLRVNPVSTVSTLKKGFGEYYYTNIPLEIADEVKLKGKSKLIWDVKNGTVIVSIIRPEQMQILHSP